MSEIGGAPVPAGERLDTLGARLHETVSTEIAPAHHYEIAREAIQIARLLLAALGEICENAYLTGTDPDWSPCAVKAEIIERARVVLGAPKP